MWIIRILSGKHEGEKAKLKLGRNSVGRTSNNDIHLPDSGISKNHAIIEVTHKEITVLDLKSSNGTFVNGVQIRRALLNNGDKVSFDDTIIEVKDVPQFIPESENQEQESLQPTGSTNNDNLFPGSNSDSGLMDEGPSGSSKRKEKVVVSQGLDGVFQIIQNYLDTVVLPGIYKIPEYLEFKWVLALFLSIFVLSVTTLSTIPLIQILKDSVAIEGERRAMSIARSLATVNRDPLSQGLESATSISITEKEEGVSRAFVISNSDGTIIAPSTQAGDFLEIDYVHTARRTGKEQIKQVSSGKIIALSPIEFYKPETGKQVASAYAVIEYDMATLSTDNAQTIRLFIQTLFIALILGIVLYFFLYKLIEYPLASLNKQLDRALKDEDHREIHSSYIFPTLSRLITNVNSALTRVDLSTNDDSINVQYDRNTELNNLVHLIGFPALAITAHDKVIASSNAGFSEKTGLDSANLNQQALSQLTDQALRLNIFDLLDRSDANPEQIHSGEIEFGGHNHEIIAQAIYGSDKIAYTLIIIIPLNEEDAA